MLGGSLRFAFLAAGLFLSLRAYRKSGFLVRLAVIDWLFLAAAGAFVLREASDVIFAMQHDKHPSTAEVLGWPTDPLLGCFWRKACYSTDPFARWARDGLDVAGRLSAWESR